MLQRKDPAGSLSRIALLDSEHEGNNGNNARHDLYHFSPSTKAVVVQPLPEDTLRQETYIQIIVQPKGSAERRGNKFKLNQFNYTAGSRANLAVGTATPKVSKARSHPDSI